MIYLNEKSINEIDINWNDIVTTIEEALCNNCLNTYSEDDVIMFNPMGMAVFDIALGKYYVDKGWELEVGQVLD